MCITSTRQTHFQTPSQTHTHTQTHTNTQTHKHTNTHMHCLRLPVSWPQEYMFNLRPGNGRTDQRIRMLLRVLNMMYSRRAETRQRGLYLKLPRVWTLHRSAFIVEVCLCVFLPVCLCVCPSACLPMFVVCVLWSWLADQSPTPPPLVFASRRPLIFRRHHTLYRSRAFTSASASEGSFPSAIRFRGCFT